MSRSVFSALALSVLIGASASAETELRGLFEQYGLRPTPELAPAPDFSLPMLQGSTGSLSDFGGDWIVLTFWATWCGPCRAELPSLERVHQQRAETGLAVVGVSLDSSRAAADAFVEELDLSFPNFSDETGRVGADYRASSIPLTYIIDPLGRIQAISRGARDWTRLLPMIDSLQQSISPGKNLDASFGASAPVQLATVQQPPTGRWRLSDDAPEVGELFELEIAVQWAGRINDYLLQPPVVHLPEEIIQQRVTASTSSRDGRNVLTYAISLLASAPGVYSLDPIELRYIPQFEASPQASRLVGPEITVHPRRVLGLSKQQMTFLAGGSVGAGILGFLGLRRVRARAGRSTMASELPHQRLKSRYDEATALRLKGLPTEAILIFGEIELELVGEDHDLEPHWESLVERARYGGEAPASGEIDLWQRRIERQIAELRPDSEAAARDNLRLRNTS